MATVERISIGALAYAQERARNDWYNFVLTRFREAQENDGLTVERLARRIGRRPATVRNLLGAPGGWNLETISTLLAGITGEIVLPHSRPTPELFARPGDGKHATKDEAQAMLAREVAPQGVTSR